MNEHLLRPKQPDQPGGRELPSAMREHAKALSKHADAMEHFSSVIDSLRDPFLGVAVLGFVLVLVHLFTRGGARADG